MTNVRAIADYQDFGMNTEGEIIRIGHRMGKKLEALGTFGGFDKFAKGKRVLDVGCDMGFWSFLAANAGATRVVGIDRNREVRNHGYTDLVQINNESAAMYGLGQCTFQQMELGTEWRRFGDFDTVLMFSLYHHVYQATGGDHASIWYWLRRHLVDDGVLLWENPWSLEDGVADAHVKVGRDRYTWADMCEGYAPYFELEHMTSACHVQTRVMAQLKPRPPLMRAFAGVTKHGAGGASKAFEHNDGARCREIQHALGFRPYPGSLNVHLAEPFTWDRDYYRVQISDVADRRDPRKLAQPWIKRWARFYSVRLNGAWAFVFRFEGESYPLNFVEVICNIRLRDHVGDKVELIKEG